ncbi:MAG: putative DNA binding domain-containing protein [Treponema sp.]|nr:putative DNA binding domain-containing protein [Treponema sp.]
MKHEGIQIEYKREYVDNFKYSVIAFANGEGGQILFGMNDDGSVCGLSNVDETMLKVTNAVRDSIRPDITLFTKCENIIVEGKDVVRLTVLRGTSRPYYISGKGIRPEGVFVRQGASSVPASEAAILQMIHESSNFIYEEERSLNQELTFSQAELQFSSRSIEFGEGQKKSLGLIAPDGMYTNLGLLLSDQCPHIIKVAVFKGSSKSVFQNRREFNGSLLKQLDDAFSFLDLCNQTASEIHGLERVDSKSYPGDSIRETLLNLIVHRDYAVLSPALISVFDDRIEFVSIGGLLPQVSFDDIMLGISISRNPKLANIFYRLHLIEAYGTGILKINESYSDKSVKPKIEVSSHAFKVTLPNANFEKQQELYKIKLEERLMAVRQPFTREQQIDSLFARKQFVSRKDLEDTLSTSQANAVLILRKMLEEGKIKKVGSGKNVRYIVKH